MFRRATFFYTMIPLVILSVILYFFVNNKKHAPKVPENGLTKIVLGTDWFAQAEHGGFYQAIATGIYKKYGLDVQIKMGGPQVNGMQLLLADEVQFFIPPSYVMLQAAKKQLPVISVAAVFQKDLQILMAHPNEGNDSLEDLNGKRIIISPPTAASIWGFLTGKYGYTEDQKLPYTHSLLPFIQDKKSIQEGLLTSEPYTVEKQAHFKPVTLLLSDHGYSAYGELITCRKDYEQKNPDIVKKFVQASMEGWRTYLENPAPANALIQKDNPQMTQDLLDFAVKKLGEDKIITGGDAEKLGLGAMTDERWESFYNMLVKTNSIEPNIPFRDVYTLKYIR